MLTSWRYLCGKEQGKGVKGAGFGLVEVLVSITIMILVTTVLLVNHSAFSNHSLLRTQAFDLALAFREMQQAAVNAQAHNGFLNSFGIQWRPPNPPNDPTGVAARSLQPIVLPHTTDPALSISTVEPFGSPRLLDNDFAFLCVHNSAILNPGVGDCISGVNDRVFVIFKRPNFDAVFYEEGGGNPLNIPGLRFVIGARGRTFNYAEVGTETRAVTITRNGQITVE
jgi:type II secretory pathway pseudopilin PulG